MYVCIYIYIYIYIIVALRAAPVSARLRPQTPTMETRVHRNNNYTNATNIRNNNHNSTHNNGHDNVNVSAK